MTKGSAHEPPNEEDLRWADAATAHFALARHLMAAALSLELAGSRLDDDGEWLYDRLAKAVPTDDPDAEGFGSDREFLLDRAKSHREVAMTCAENGAMLASVLADSLRARSGPPDSWDRRDELVKSLAPYAEAVAAAAEEAERALEALDESVSNLGNSEPAETMGGIVRFLNAEAALFSKTLDEEPDSLGEL